MIQEKQIKAKRVLFFVKSIRFLRYFKSVLYALLNRGFEVVVVFDSSKVEAPSDDSLVKFSKQFHNFSWKNGPIRKGIWAKIIIPCRNIQNYRFLLLKDAEERHLRRMRQYIPTTLKKMIARYSSLTHLIIKSGIVGRFFSFVEYITLPAKNITDFINEISPDAVLVSYRSFPCQSPDIDYVKSSLALHIPTVIITPSWDQPTTKSFFQLVPDKLLMWNEEHKQAALKYHHMPEKIISTVGAPQFDTLFDTKPKRSREEFSRRFGLKDDSPFVLYIVSQSAGDRNKLLIKEIADALKNSSDPQINRMKLLVRAYPGYPAYSDVTYPHVVILSAPYETRQSLDDDMDFFEAVYYCSAPIALDSTAFIDAIVIGQPCIVYSDPRFIDIQSAEHFRALKGSGAFYSAGSMGELVAIVKKIINNHDSLGEKRVQYLEKFIRPRGIEKNVGNEVADEIEMMLRGA
ncbi:MAG: hypothetical protein Q7S15_01640 [bacterium]|nr:hypothetical protein [bacterium]